MLKKQRIEYILSDIRKMWNAWRYKLHMKLLCICEWLAQEIWWIYNCIKKSNMAIAWKSSLLIETGLSRFLGDNQFYLVILTNDNIFC